MEIRFIHLKPPCLVMLPLGCFERGQKFNLPEHGEILITNIDHDGAGIGFQTTYLRQYAQDHDLTGDQVLEKFSNWHSPSCKEMNTANPRQQQQMTNQILANRRRHGLSELDPRKEKRLGF